MRNFGKFASGLLFFALASVSSSSSKAADVNPDDFHVRTTEDLVALCSVNPSDPNYVAAIHFCHGFATGAYQYYQSTITSPGDRFVCPPDPPPTRSEAIAGFVAWANANPLHMADRPVDSIFRYLSLTYPCPQ